MDKEGKRFDHCFRQFEQDGELLQRHVQCGLKEMRLAKATAYRMATTFIEMEQHWHNELLNMIKGSGATVDEWVEAWFRPITALGEDWSALVAAIQRGMTVREYETTLPSVFVSKQKRTGQDGKNVAGGIPREAGDELSPEEALKQWRARAKALEIQLREERRKRRELERDIIALNKMVERMRKTLKIKV